MIRTFAHVVPENAFVTTPMLENLKLFVSTFPYCQLIGATLYVNVSTYMSCYFLRYLSVSAVQHLFCPCSTCYRLCKTLVKIDLLNVEA